MPDDELAGVDGCYANRCGQPQIGDDDAMARAKDGGRSQQALLDDQGWLVANSSRSTSDLAGELGCSTRLVRNAFQRHDVKRDRFVRSSRWPQLDDREWLAANARRSIHEVAGEIGCPPRVLRYALKRHGIDRGRRVTYEQLRDRRWLREHSGLRRDELAALLGCQPATAIEAYRRAGIGRQPPPRRRLFAELDDSDWLAARASIPVAVVAAELGCSPSSVSAAMHRNQIVRETARCLYPLLADRAWLSANRNRLLVGIAGELGCSPQTVLAAYRRANVVRPPRLRRPPQLDDLAWLLANQHRTFVEIARELGCADLTVSNAYRDANVARLSRYPQLDDRKWLRANRKIRTADLAATVGCSEATLLRAFRRAAIDR